MLISHSVSLVDVKTNNQPTTRTTPSSTIVILTSHDDEPHHDEFKSFNNRHGIGKLFHLEKSTILDIACAVHQCVGSVQILKPNMQKQLKELEDIY